MLALTVENFRFQQDDALPAQDRSMICRTLEDKAYQKRSANIEDLKYIIRVELKKGTD